MTDTRVKGHSDVSCLKLVLVQFNLDKTKLRGSTSKAEHLITTLNEAAAALVPRDICVRHNNPLRLSDKSPNVAPEIACLFTRI
ncbi:hypothetical protein E2C01_098904 [Portunus trituberculatus]|uniref:Uncharacterized protein n=1 Tax=Portunus trituberculatus TaxID=210409 RepID=A0A5B7KFB5_PORTR|nr:hypothetical protein [Portunus trituberculatus]